MDMEGNEVVAPFTGHAKRDAANFNVPREWQFLRTLGSGASGSVSAFRVRGTNYAVKKIHDVLSSQYRATRLLREVKLMMHLKHFNIVSFDGIYIEGPHFRDVYLCMELMETNLDQFMGVFKNALGEHQIMHIMFQILRAACCIHTAGVCHRDRKPASILVKGAGEVKLSGFGLSRVLPAHTCDGGEPLTACMVSQFYSAPEVFLHAQHSFSLDIWSVGCIFAELIQFQVLFLGKDTLDQFRQIVVILGNPSAEDAEWIPREGVARGFLRFFYSPANGAGFRKFLQTARATMDEETLELVIRMLKFSPNKRATARECLFAPCMRRFLPEADEVTTAALQMTPADGTREKAMTCGGSFELAFREHVLDLRSSSRVPVGIDASPIELPTETELSTERAPKAVSGTGQDVTTSSPSVGSDQTPTCTGGEEPAPASTVAKEPSFLHGDDMPPSSRSAADFLSAIRLVGSAFQAQACQPTVGHEKNKMESPAARVHINHSPIKVHTPSMGTTVKTADTAVVAGSSKRSVVDFIFT